MKRFFFSGFALGSLLLFFGWWGFFELFLDWDLAGDGGSRITHAESYPSPDEGYTAFTYYESGGGAAGWSYYCVSIDNDPSFPYSNEYDVFRIVPSETKLELNWIETNTLMITYELSNHTTVWRNQSQRFDGVNVIFNPID